MHAILDRQFHGEVQVDVAQARCIQGQAIQTKQEADLDRDEGTGMNDLSQQASHLPVKGRADFELPAGIGLVAIGRLEMGILRPHGQDHGDGASGNDVLGVVLRWILVQAVERRHDPFLIQEEVEARCVGEEDMRQEAGYGPRREGFEEVCHECRVGLRFGHANEFWDLSVELLLDFSDILWRPKIFHRDMAPTGTWEVAMRVSMFLLILMLKFQCESSPE